MTADRNDTDQRERQRGPFIGCLATAIIFALPAYVLSIGPAAWLLKHGYIPQEACIIYAPLGILANYCRLIGEALNRYIVLWGGQ